MNQEYKAVKIIYAPRCDGKMIKYITELAGISINESQYQLTKFSTQEIEDVNVYPETVHYLASEEIIFNPDDIIHRLTHKGKNIRPIRMGTLDVYPINYEVKPHVMTHFNIPSDLILDVIEKIPKRDDKKETRGRHKKYSNDIDRKVAQQRHALLHHYRKEALTNYLKSNPNDDIITVKVNVESKVLGNISEEITYKRLTDGSYRKLQQ